MSENNKKGRSRINWRSDITENVKFDDRGNPVWRWDRERILAATDDVQRTLQYLKSLDNASLTLEDAEDDIPSRRSGGDPYNSADDK